MHVETFSNRSRPWAAERTRAPGGPPGFETPRPAGIHVVQGRFWGHTPEGRPRVRLSDTWASVVVATWALPYRYVPAQGDVFSLVGRAGTYYVTGVVHGRGRSRLAFEGDLGIRARGGSLRLSARRGVRVVGRRVTLRAQTLEVLAVSLHEKVGRATRTVRGLLEEHAAQALRVVEGSETQLAGRRSIVAKGVARLGGRLLKMGS